MTVVATCSTPGCKGHERHMWATARRSCPWCGGPLTTDVPDALDEGTD